MVLARVVKLALALLTAFAGLWIGAYVGFWTAAVFEELYRPFADGLSDLHSRTGEAMTAMVGILGVTFAVLGYRHGHRLSRSAAVIGAGIGLYVGIWMGDFVGDWYWPYATREHNLLLVAYLITPLLWAMLLAVGGYVLGRHFERPLNASDR